MPYGSGVTLTESLPCDWDYARWIMAEGEHDYVLFRREFFLNEIDKNTVLFIFADIRYRVYINGCYVGDGPRRGNPLVYQPYLIGTLLTKGNNTIAVESYNPEEANRLICRIATNNGESTVLCSDDSWRYIDGTMWGTKSPGSTLQSRIEVYDMRKELEGWRNPGFDCGDWREVLVGDLPGENELQPDAVPPVTRSLVHPTEITRFAEAVDICSGVDPDNNVALRLAYEPWDEPCFTGMEGEHGFITPEKGPVRIYNKHMATVSAYYQFLRDESQPGSVRCPTVVLDFGRLINGSFYFEIDAEDGTQLDIGFSQLLVGGRVPTVLYGGDKMWGNKADRIILRAGGQSWESFHWEQIRFVQLTFRNITKKVTIHKFGLIDRQVALPRIGSFSCSDKVITDLWDATERTLQATTCEVFTDNCIREKIGFAGECGSRSLMTSWITSGNQPLARHFIRQFTRAPERRCFLAYAVDTAIKKKANETGEHIYLFHALQTWYALSFYHLFAEPNAYQEDGVLEACRAFIDYLIPFLNTRGLLASPLPWDCWLDWVPGKPDKSGKRTWDAGEGAPQNLFLCLLLQNHSNTELALGNNDIATKYQSMAGNIEKRIYDEFWDEKRGLYVDSLIDGKQYTAQYSEHTNTLALLAGLGRGGRDQIIANSLSAICPDLIQTEAMFSHFPASAYFFIDRGDLGLNCLKEKYGKMLEGLPNPTLWEERSCLMTVRGHRWQGRYRSLAQSSSAVPAYLLSTEVLGIKPVQPGFAAFDIRPQPCGLKWAEGVVPTPHGNIHLRWEIEGNTFSLAVEIPEGTHGRLHLAKGQSYYIDGNPLSVCPLNTKSEPVRVDSGQHRLMINGCEFIYE